MTSIGRRKTGSALIAAIFPGMVAMTHTVAGQTSAETGTIVGFVVDSIRGGVLRGATVTVAGTQIAAVTDSVGQFRIDNVPVGPRSLRISHPLLDTLALGVASPEKELKSSGALSFALSIPSASTIVARRCSAADREKGSAALTGVVIDADTEMPSDGAEVIVSWTDYSLTSKTMAASPQRRSSRVHADGSYLVCGIPDDLATGVIAARGADSTAAVTIDFQAKLGILSLALPHAESAVTVKHDSIKSSGPRGRAVVTGRVLDDKHRPVAGARVSIESDGVESISRSDGTFDLRGARAGTRLLTARKLGFVPREIAVNVSARDETTLDVTFGQRVQMLEAVKISALKEIGIERVGFNARKKWGLGRYYTPKEIEQRNPLKLNYLLETASMLRTSTMADGRRVVNGRGYHPCLRYFIDGVLQIEHNPGELDLLPDSYLSSSELGAVEVYDRMSVPGEFIAISRSGQVCSVVVIWTKFKLGVR